MPHETTWFANKRILVTGGAGFIGSHLVRRLAGLGARVTAADDLSRGNGLAIAGLTGTTFIQSDLRVEAQAMAVTADQDIVFNLAAFNTGVDYDIGRTQKMFEENMLLQLVPIRAAAANRVPLFIQISSASIYSTAAMEQRAPTTETDDGGEPEPSKLGYALAKRMGENLAKWYALNTSMQTRIARFINVYGPGDHFDYLGHFLPAVINKFTQADGEIRVFGTGGARRSFLHVDDAVEGVLTLAQHGANGEAYNIDPQDEHTIREMVQMIQKVMGRQATRIVWDTTAPEGSCRRILDNAKIKNIGWRPKRTLSESTVSEIVNDIGRRHENP
jgi:nucleoside-diphosphate-sugar epimerase